MSNQELQAELMTEFGEIVRYLAEFHPNLAEFRHYMSISLEEVLSELIEEGRYEH